MAMFGAQKGKKMDNNHPLVIALKNLTHDLRLFIELSLQETDASWEEWLRLILKEGGDKCWEMKKCSKKDCPAYLNADVRCWLVAGTLSGEEAQCEFAVKYKHCTECGVYKESVFKDPVTETYEHVVTLIHSLRLTQDKLKVMAVRDPLTGVFNRNYFNEMIANEINRTRRYGQRFSIVILDIDNFKQINDDYGHLIGDWILRECALILGMSIRSSDLLVRFGGDEFLVVTLETDLNECRSLISRIHERLSIWNREHNNPYYGLSVSIGCSLFDQGKDLMEVIQEADSRMYQNKLKPKF
ncbi:MAG: GGDEF domain-containing protein [Nitrospirae bacterium]|nr:GGDEF domain-containing protein [Nitrospirota bacterium]